MKLGRLGHTLRVTGGFDALLRVVEILGDDCVVNAFPGWVVVTFPFPLSDQDVAAAGGERTTPPLVAAPLHKAMGDRYLAALDTDRFRFETCSLAGRLDITEGLKRRLLADLEGVPFVALETRTQKVQGTPVQAVGRLRPEKRVKLSVTHLAERPLRQTLMSDFFSG